MINGICGETPFHTSPPPRAKHIRQRRITFRPRRRRRGRRSGFWTHYDPEGRLT